MTVLFILGLVAILLFTFQLIIGPPFLPTLRAKAREGVEMLNMKAGQTLVELGSGDGRILNEAAKKGIISIGYEINPALVLYSKLLTFKQRKLIQIHWGNYWKAPLSKADGIYVFCLDKYMQKLNNKIVQECHQPLTVVSFAFKFPKLEAIEQKGGFFLYKFNSPTN